MPAMDRPDSASPERGRGVLAVRLALWSLLVTKAGLDWWIGRDHIHSDGLAYLDIASLYASGQVGAAVNGTWSPLYSWLLSLPLTLGTPGGSLEAPLTGMLSLVIVLAAYAALEHLTLAVLRGRTTSPSGLRALPDWLVLAAAGLLGLWALLELIRVDTRNPDALVVALIAPTYVLALRLGRGVERARTWGGLGVLLGLGYLAKAPMLPVGVVAIAAAWWASPDPDRRRKACIAALGLAALSLPWIAALSLKYGHLTFSENGRYNYARMVSHEVLPMHWQGQPPGSGVPTHPTRQVHSNPNVYEFAEPVRGTFPPWQDLGYWYGGLRTSLDAGAQAAAVRRNVGIYARLMSGEALTGGTRDVTFPLFLASGIVLVLGLRGLGRWRQTAGVWMPVLATFGLYALVHAEPRYVALQAWMLAVAPLCAARWRTALPRQAAMLVLFMAVALVAVARLRSTAWNVRNEWQHLRAGDLGQSSDWQARVADALAAEGVRAGSHFGFVGSSYRFYWARLAQGRVIAEIRQYDQDARNPGTLLLDDGVAARNAASDPRDADRFWRLGPEARNSVLDAFRRAGVEWLVADSVRADSLPPGWRRLGATSWVVLDLRLQRNARRP